MWAIHLGRLISSGKKGGLRKKKREKKNVVSLAGEGCREEEVDDPIVITHIGLLTLSLGQ